MNFLIFSLSLLVFNRLAWWGFHRLFQVNRPDAPGHSRLNLSQIAYLCGGRSHLFPMLWLSLRQRGLLVPEGEPTQTPSRYRAVPPTRIVDEIDEFAHLLSSQAPNLSSSNVNKATESHLKKVEHSLVQAGLILSPDRFGTCVPLLWMVGVGSLVISFIGFIFSGTGPVLSLFAGLGLGVCIAAFMIGSAFAVEWAGLTRQGVALREKLAVLHGVEARAPQHDKLPLAVAVGGVAVLLGTPFASWAQEMSGHQAVDRSSVGTAGDGGTGSLVTGTSSSGAKDETLTASQFFSGGGFPNSSDGFSDGAGDGGGCGGGGCGGGGCG